VQCPAVRKTVGESRVPLQVYQYPSVLKEHQTHNGWLFHQAPNFTACTGITEKEEEYDKNTPEPCTLSYMPPDFEYERKVSHKIL
jgi:hypothetical protein